MILSAVRPTRAVLLVLLLAIGLVRAVSGQEITFHLVPEDAWQDEKTRPEAILPDGKVYLFAEGSYEPAAVFPVNIPYRLEPGNWLWVAEAPGYVSVGSGALRIGPKTAGEKRLLWPVVPACRIDFSPAGDWVGVQRLDLVSLDRAAVYPVIPGQRPFAWVPAGRFLAYTVGPRGLLGIAPPEACQQSEDLPLAPPPSPRRGLQDLLVRLRLPDGFEPGKQEVQALWKPLAADSVPGEPTAMIRQGESIAAFFLALPASAEGEITVSHPALRTFRQPVEPLESVARELPEIRLRPRRSLDLTIDYRPKVPHKTEAIRLLYCGPDRRPPRIPGKEPCAASGQELRLRPGLATYNFPGLDDGLYYPEAKIDDEVLRSLGSGVSVYLDPASESVDPVLPVVLQEMEIYGNILLDGEPVAGMVRVEPTAPGRFPVRTFTTDDELLYHWTFFGRSPWMPEPEGTEPQLGFFSGLERVLACADQELCRDFGLHSEFRGEGRLDIEVRPGRAVTVSVVDADDGTPLPEAVVRYRNSFPDLKFDNGRVEWREPEGGELSHGYTTKSDGRVTLSIPRELSEPLAVTRREYRNREAEVPPGAGPVELRVALEAESPREPAVRLVLRPDGKPLARAFLLVIRNDGARDPGCSVATDAQGEAEIGPDCLRSSSVVVLHPDAAITLVRGEALLGSAEVALDPAPARPVELRIVDGSGAPIPRLPIRLQYGGFSLEPNDLLLAAGRTGSLLFYASGSDGGVQLRGVDPSAADVPVVLPGDPAWQGNLPLSGVVGGAVVELVVRR